MAYSIEEKIEPFWAEYSTAASGRDPLAIQNSSVVIYTKMVVGITNVTNRIRYNGFFCWIFDTVLQKIEKKNSLQEQIRYSRRAELLLANIMVKNFPNVTGVSGSDYATKNMGSIIDLESGADMEFKRKGEKVFWQNSQGIFGQYYKGVTRVLNLLNHPNAQVDLNVYTPTEKGKELAEAFIEHIPQEQLDLFWKSVYDGYISESDLEKLSSFALHVILEGSKECKFYEEMLYSADDRKASSTFHRKETIDLLLSEINKHSEGIEDPASAFLRSNYLDHIDKEALQLNSATAWYLFETNELIHVAYEHFHGCFLYFIETFPTSMEDKIDTLVKSALQQFTQEESLEGIHTVRQLDERLQESREDIYTSYENMTESFRQSDYGSCLMHAVKTMVGVQVNSKHQLNQLNDFASSLEFNFNRIGYAVDLIEGLVVSKIDMSIESYVRAVLLKAINLHVYSSYSKTKIGQSLVHNYMVEDYSVWRLRETMPGRTTPRLQNVLQYITDIDWIKREDKVYTITDKGIKTLEGK
jgi:hypothetical protein